MCNDFIDLIFSFVNYQFLCKEIKKKFSLLSEYVSEGGNVPKGGKGERREI